MREAFEECDFLGELKLRLSRLIGEPLGKCPNLPYTEVEFARKVNRLLVRYGCKDKPRSLESEEDLHRWIFRYAMKMTEITYGRLHTPPDPVPEELYRCQSNAMQDPPPIREDYCQGRVDVESACRRAWAIHRFLQDYDFAGDARVLFLGDDDAASVALSFLGNYEVWVLDIDPQVLNWLEASGRSLRLIKGDIRCLPGTLKGTFPVVVTDPVRDALVGVRFLRAARKCMGGEGAVLFWCDHPDWNHGYPYLRSTLENMGFKLIKTWENWHSYSGSYYKDDSTAIFLGIEPAWLRRLSCEIKLWSHLHALRLKT